ncbi:hypothetical protein BVC80_8683g2 [Macleaya cordata]|uniref:RNA recognition motif domain n=1 Tax=Macleaya cordata TaxID=56857 RepID=A0A200Q0G8_MACCD|nr:hypothetical protein BVC80_8683g2 [Macleaya cordata]
MAAESWILNGVDDIHVPQDQRTMFITFSQGYPITEGVLRDFFVGSYGEDCIEEIYMQRVAPNKQSMFARVIFRSPSTIDAILDGMERTRITINGRQIYVRRYIKKRNGSPPPPPPGAAGASIS